jgi:hypothetical protein
MLRNASLLTAALALCACEAGMPTSPAGPGELRSAPTSIVVDGRALTLRASLWRDFMPISPPDGRPLAAVLQVQPADGTPVSPSIRATAVYVVLGGDVWTAAALEERPRSETAPAYEVVARDGPKWGPDVNVDVVVRLTDGSRSWLLRAPEQRISAAF